jgi:hypothetical protein
MVLYPIAYVVLSLPLAAGRMATAQGHTPSVVYFCVAGAMMTSSGFVDMLMYTVTRRTLITDSEHSGDGSHPNPSRYYEHRSNHIATVTATVTADSKRYAEGILSRFQGHDVSNRNRTRNGQNLTSINCDYHSTDNIIAHNHDTTAVELDDLEHVNQKTTTIEITSEPAYPTRAPSEVSQRILEGGNQERISSSRDNPNGSRYSIDRPKPAWVKTNRA